MSIASTSFALGIASFKAQMLGSFFTSGADGAGNAASSSGASNSFLSALNASANTTGLSPSGLNQSLADPQAAYNMMTLINSEDVTYKAQFSELSQMQSAVAQMQDAGQSLGGITTATSDDAIQTQLQTFVGQYNQWVQRFNPDMQSGGLLAGTQAAEASRHELEASVENILNGSKDGIYGLQDIGITIDPSTHLASLDATKLDSVLASDKQGAVDTVQAFSANFAASASMLNASGNFIPTQLNNLSSAIDYISNNDASLTAEFGTGAPAQPTGQVAQALAAYNQTSGSV